jgi:hypothetical protein
MAAPKQERRTLTIALPTTFELVAIGAVLAALAGGAAWLYFKGHSDGYAQASSDYQAQIAAQAAANAKAAEQANQQIFALADAASAREAELEQQLADIDANSGGAGATDLGLSAARMQALGKIR